MADDATDPADEVADLTDPAAHADLTEVPEAARAALARARLAAAEAAGQAERRSSQLPRTASRRAAAGSYSGSRPDDRDPQSLSTGWERLAAQAGWADALRASRLHEMWPEIVGGSVAEHTQVESFNPADGVLLLRASSTAWAESLRLLLPTITAALDGYLGAGVVTRVQISGPTAPSWTHGRLRAKGRGPRDTYG